MYIDDALINLVYMRRSVARFPYKVTLQIGDLLLQRGDLPLKSFDYLIVHGSNLSQHREISLLFPLTAWGDATWMWG